MIQLHPTEDGMSGGNPLRFMRAVIGHILVGGPAQLGALVLGLPFGLATRLGVKSGTVVETRARSNALVSFDDGGGWGERQTDALHLEPERLPIADAGDGANLCAWSWESYINICASFPFLCHVFLLSLSLFPQPEGKSLSPYSVCLHQGTINLHCKQGFHCPASGTNEFVCKEIFTQRKLIWKTEVAAICQILFSCCCVSSSYLTRHIAASWTSQSFL